MSIKILDSERILVSAYTHDKRIMEAFIQKSMPRILKLQAKIKQEEQKRKANALYYLGGAYTINTMEAEVNEVVFHNGIATIKHTPYIDPKKLMEKYLSDKCNELFRALIEENIKKLGYDFKPKLIIKLLKSKWGYCRFNENLICLNAGLIYTPLPCINYVVAHELIHFIHHNHQKAFHDTLEQIVPNHRKIEKELKSYGFLLK